MSFSFGGTGTQTPSFTFGSGSSQPSSTTTTQQGSTAPAFSFGSSTSQSTPSFQSALSSQQQQQQQQPFNPFSSTTSTFGPSVTQAPSFQGQNFLGQPVQQQQQQQQPSSSFFQSQQQQPLYASVGGPDVVASSLTMEAQLSRMKDMWDPGHEDNAFQYYFYNRVPADQAALYTKPSSHNQKRWEDAIRQRPDANCVPVLAVGFGDLKKRVTLQEQQVVAYRHRMHEIVSKLTEINQHHSINTNTKIEESKRRHARLLQRLINVAGKIQILKYRGYALRPEEEALRTKIRKLTSQIRGSDSPLNSLTEVRARLFVGQERVKSLALDNSENNPSRGGIDWERSGHALQDIEKILKEQQVGLLYLTNLLNEEMAKIK